MLNPAFKLTIGGKQVDTTRDPSTSTVTDLAIRLDMDTPADSMTILLGQVNGLQPSVGDHTTVSLGYSDNGGVSQVMTGSVTRVEPNATTKRVVAHSPAAVLLRSFTENTYEGKNAGEIVKDLAAQAGVDVETADDGIDFPAFIVDGQRNFFHHMKSLAELCGFDLYFNADGKLVFEEFGAGNQVHVFQYAKDVVQWSDTSSPAEAGTVEAWGESSTDSQGADSWGWLTKDFSGSKGTAGSGDPKYLLQRPALRTGKAAQAAADAVRTRMLRNTVRGRFLTLGQAGVQLGDAIKFRGMPDGTMNQTFQVRSVTHHISKSRGFTSFIGFRAVNT
jgi:phage protein D